MVTAAQIKSLCPRAAKPIVDAVVANWSEADKAGINTPLRIAHFFAQIAHESGGLRAVEESLTYTSASRIQNTWKKRFPTLESAQPFVRNPKALAIKVYGGRMGNAAAPSTDGWDYRGGGLMQTTGREGYAKMGFETNPEALRDPKTAFLSAVREWTNRGCNALADKDDVTAIRRRINGGVIGLADVQAKLAEAKEIFATVAKPDAAPVVAMLDADGVKALQEKLIALGYTEVGKADGQYGSRTRGAILAFEADNNLALTGEASIANLGAVNLGKKRVISAARETASQSDVADRPAVSMSTTLQKLGAGVLATSGIGAVFDGSGDLEKVMDSANKMKAIADSVMSISPWILGAVAGVAVIMVGKSIIRHFIQEYREGRIL